MRISFTGYLIVIVIMTGGSSMTNAQDFGRKMEQLVDHTYPSAGDPGGAFFVQRNDTVFAKGTGRASIKTAIPVTLQTQFRLASVSKQFTAYAIYKLKNAGKLHYAMRLAAIFDELPPAVGAITIGQLLQHTSGIWDYEALIPDDRKTQLSDEDVLRLIRQRDTTYFAPGSKFRYSNTGYCLLALVVERISGVSFPDFVKQYLFDPLQLTGARVYKAGEVIVHRAYGYHPEKGRFRFADQSITSATKGDGGVYMSVAAYSRWAEEIRDSSGYFREIEQNAFPVKEGIRYNLGWFVCKEADGSTSVFHSGESTGFHNIVYLNPRKHIKIILFGNRDDLKISALFDQIAKQVQVGPEQLLKSGQPLFVWLSRLYGDE